MAFSKGRKNSVTIEELLEKVSEAEILGHYLNIKEVPCVINSPMRIDKHKSLGISSHDGQTISYRDFKTGDTGSLFKLLTKSWGFSNIYETVDKINKELVHNLKGRSANINKSKEGLITKISKSVIDLKCKVREWKDWDLKYWEQYGISLPWLQFSNTYPISHTIVTKDGITSTILAEKYAYAYVELKDGIESLKIYQPYSKKHKWTNNHDSSVWDMWAQLPKTGEDLIITSSRKDALCIWSNTGIPSCSLQAESYLPKAQVIEELKKRFKKIWVLYDNDYEKEDNPGRTLGMKICKEFGLTQIEIPRLYLSKDSSDLYYNHGARTLVDVIFKLINKKSPF